MDLKQISFMLLVIIYCAVATTQAAYSGPTTKEGVDLIKSFEGFRANFYTDPVIYITAKLKGIKTIGYGYSCKANPCNNIKPPITKEQATNLLKTTLKPFEKCVRNNVKYANLNAAQFSALVSFSFNVGCGALKESTLLWKLNNNDVKGASHEFAKWNEGGGKVLPGLTRRREAERKMFCSNNVC